MVVKLLSDGGDFATPLDCQPSLHIAPCVSLSLLAVPKGAMVGCGLWRGMWRQLPPQN